MRIGSWLELKSTDGLSFEALKARLEVPNPEYVSAIEHGFSTAGLHRFDPLYEEAMVAGVPVLRVPRGLVTKYGGGKEVEDCRLDGKEVKLRLTVELGPTQEREEDQKDFVASLVKAVKETGGAIGQASPGYGKTVCASAVIAELGRTTAVLVHKSFLMNQWIERLQESLDIKPEEIGVVQQGICDFRGKKIVLIMAQSLLSSREYPEDLYSYFGTVVVDEVHRFGAVEFRRAITMFPAKYRIGVTATPKRKDGLENVFFMHIGEIAHVGTKSTLTAKVKYVNADMIVTDYMKRNMLNYRGQYDMNKVTQYIVDSETRNLQIIRLLTEAVKAGRKVMLLSSRRDHLNTLAVGFEAYTAERKMRIPYGFYVGGMGEQDLRISSTRSVILATFQMAQEGLDIPDLDTLFLATPKGDIVQAVGRILRKCSSKRPPIVLDILDNGVVLCERLAMKRARQYKEMGCSF